LSAAYHLGHERVRVLEAKPYLGGHVHTRYRDGFTWDEGPHISFTRSDYVRDLFAESVGGEFETLEIQATNYFRGGWIDHPAQVNLYQVPEPLRSRCLESFVASRDDAEAAADTPPASYREWLHRKFGPVFADTFPAAYTRKYWTTDPADLDVDWVGYRVYAPSVEEVTRGAQGPLDKATHYITTARYPAKGGYIRYADVLAEGAPVELGKCLEQIDFARRWMGFADGSEASYQQLVSTIPLPELIAAAVDVPDDVREATAALRCTELLLVEVAADHPSAREEQWLYVYDEDKHATRINFTELLSPQNAPPGTTGCQVEVYGSAYRPLPADRGRVADEVVDELVEMGLVRSREHVLHVNAHHVPYANVIFDLQRRDALATVNAYLDERGVARAGRYAEWAYLWTDDAVLSGKRVAEELA
jgi:protoporphyrinogen oxidase